MICLYEELISIKKRIPTSLLNKLHDVNQFDWKNGHANINKISERNVRALGRYHFSFRKIETFPVIYQVYTKLLKFNIICGDRRCA